MNINGFDLIKSFLPLLISCIPFLFVLGIIIIIVYCWKNKVKIKYRTFKGKGFRPSRGNFGLFVYCGAQGKGKTYSLVEYLIDNSPRIVVFSNITNISNVENITYFNGFKGLIDIKHALDNGDIKINPRKQLVIVFDEIFTELQRGDKIFYK